MSTGAAGPMKGGPAQTRPEGWSGGGSRYSCRGPVRQGAWALSFCFFVWTGLAGTQVLADQGRADQERAVYEDLARRFAEEQIRRPEDPALHYNLGWTDYRLGRYAEAAGNFAAAAERAEQADPALAAKARYNQGNALFRADRLEQADEAYQAALALDPGDEQARANLAFTRRKMEEKKRKQDRRDPGQQGQSGQPGDSGQHEPGDPPGQSGESRQSGQPGQGGQAGQTGQSGETGQSGQPGPDGKHPDPGEGKESGQPGADRGQPNPRGDGQPGQGPRDQDPGAGAAGPQSETKDGTGSAAGQAGPDRPGVPGAQTRAAQAAPGRDDAPDTGGAPDQAPRPDRPRFAGEAPLVPGQAPPAGNAAEGAQAETSQPGAEGPAGQEARITGGVLNRLKDRPGRGLVPRTRPGRVEKDW